MSLFDIITVFILAFLLSKDTIRLFDPQMDIDAMKMYSQKEVSDPENMTDEEINKEVERMKPLVNILFAPNLLFITLFSYKEISIFSMITLLVYNIRNSVYLKSENLKKSTVRGFALIPQSLMLILIGTCLMLRG